jgi:hypothetical protein
MIRIIVSLSIILLSFNVQSQNWLSNSLNNGAFGTNFGNSANLPINIFTNNTNIARFSSPGAPCSGLNGTGQGLRIRNFSAGAPAGLGEIDIFTTGGSSNKALFFLNI